MYPKQVKAKVGERIQFVCVVSGFGQNYSIKWYNSDNPDKALLTTHSHVLDIPLVQLNDSGTYYCVVKKDASFASNNSTLQVIGISEPYVCMCACICVYVCMRVPAYVYVCACVCMNIISKVILA